MFIHNYQGKTEYHRPFLEAKPPNTQVCPSACLFQLAFGEVSLIILTSAVVMEYHRVFHNYPGQK